MSFLLILGVPIISRSVARRDRVSLPKRSVAQRDRGSLFDETAATRFISFTAYALKRTVRKRVIIYNLCQV